MLRKHGVVGKFVEFYGEGVSQVPLANRATIGNMSPEFGSTCAIFPIDDVTLDYLRLTGRSDESVALVEAYAKEQGMWLKAGPDQPEARYSEYLELDLSTVVPSIAGPKRPQDRIALSDAKDAFRKVLPTYVAHDEGDSGDAESFPASDPARRLDDGTATATARPTARRNGRPSKKVSVTDAEGREFEIDHGIVSIASITSCTNTSNPSVMMAAAMLAKNAVEKGLSVAPWVKTSMAPGSKVVTGYYEKAGMWPYLEKLGFHLVGYGCTTCIGNSGPLNEEISAAINDNDLAVTSVLSGNRNFEGRINPDVKMNYLASPPLVIAYALAGTMDFDFESEPLGQDTDGNDVFLEDIWPAPADVEATIASSISQEMFTDDYADVFAGDERWQSLPTPEGDTFAWDGESTYVRKPPYFDGMTMETTPVADIEGARVLAKLGDSVTTDHISPAGAIKNDSPAGKYLADARHRAQGLQLLRLASRQPRGHDPRHVRQHPPEEPAPRRRRGRLHPRLPQRRRADDDLRRRAELPGGGHPARHPRRARSTAPAARATGRPRARACSASRPSSPRATSASTAPTSSAWASSRCSTRRARTPTRSASTAPRPSRSPASRRSTRARRRRRSRSSRPRSRRETVEFDAVVRIDTPGEADYYRNGGILQYVLRSLVNS